MTTYAEEFDRDRTVDPVTKEPYADVVLDAETQRRILDAYGRMPYAGGLAHSPLERVQTPGNRTLISPTGLAAFLEDLGGYLSDVSKAAEEAKTKVRRYDRIALAAGDFVEILADLRSGVTT